MPLDGAAELGGLHVQLVAVPSNSLTYELRDDVQKAFGAQDAGVDGMLVCRILESSQSRRLLRVTGFEVEDVVALGNVAGLFDERIGDPPEFGDLFRRNDIVDTEIAVGLVEVDLVGAERAGLHGHHNPIESFSVILGLGELRIISVWTRRDPKNSCHHCGRIRILSSSRKS